MSKAIRCVTGGTFAADPSAYIAAGYAVKEVDGVYTVYALTVGSIIELAGQKAIVYSVDTEAVKAVSVAELKLKGKTCSDAATWAEGLGTGWALASIYDLDAIHTVRTKLNVALAANSADNALFCENEYVAEGKYALYVSSTVAEGSDPQGETYFANRIMLKYFNLNGYWDYPYSTFATINKSAPLKDNYFARGVYEIK